MFKEKGDANLFILIFILNFVCFSSSAALGVIPTFLSSLGAGKTYVGFFMNLSSLEIVFFTIIFGKYLHFLKKKESLFISSIISIFSLFLSFLFSKNLVILMFLRFLSVVPFVFAFSMHTSVIFDIVKKEKRLTALAIFGTSGILSNPAGSFLSEVFSKNFGGSSLFILAMIFVIIYIFLLLFFKEPRSEFHKTHSKSFFHILIRKEILTIIIFASVFGGAFSVYASFIPNFSKERLGTTLLSAYFIPFAATTLFIRFFLSGLLDKIKRAVLIFISYFAIFISSVLILFLDSTFMLVLVGIFYGIGHSVLYPTVGTMFVDSGKPEEKEILNNSFVAAHTFGAVFIAALLGIVGDFGGLVSVFKGLLVVTSITLLYCVFYFFIEKKSKALNLNDSDYPISPK
ncbi:MAG TPA: MFS transporter [Spirochaetota bacterium]|nr:MFS transporter [Spirochaetota bacterium]